MDAGKMRQFVQTEARIAIALDKLGGESEQYPRKPPTPDPACEQNCWLDHLGRRLAGMPEGQSYAIYCTCYDAC